MPDWMSEVESERLRAEMSRNQGRTRTAARRIAGIAIKEYRKHFPEGLRGDEFIRLLQSFAALGGIPGEVGDAAQRLSARISPDFTSPSVDPLGDASIIVEFVKTKTAEKE